jgi:hypothetical protein
MRSRRYFARPTVRWTSLKYEQTRQTERDKHGEKRTHPKREREEEKWMMKNWRTEGMDRPAHCSLRGLL